MSQRTIGLNQVVRMVGCCCNGSANVTYMISIISYDLVLSLDPPDRIRTMSEINYSYYGYETTAIWSTERTSLHKIDR